MLKEAKLFFFNLRCPYMWPHLRKRTTWLERSNRYTAQNRKIDVNYYQSRELLLFLVKGTANNYTGTDKSKCQQLHIVEISRSVPCKGASTSACEHKRGWPRRGIREHMPWLQHEAKCCRSPSQWMILFEVPTPGG